MNLLLCVLFLAAPPTSAEDISRAALTPHTISVDELQNVSLERFPGVRRGFWTDWEHLRDEMERDNVTIEWVRWWAYYWQHYAWAEHNAMPQGLGLDDVGFMRCCYYYGMNKPTFMSVCIPKPSPEEAKAGRRPDRQDPPAFNSIPSPYPMN